MTRRERKEAKLAKRLEWAESRKAKSEQAFESARVVADGIPLGQPILVGHHSEKRHRRDIARIDNGMRRGVESSKMANHHLSVAAGIEHQLETSVFSDDPDAIESLEARIAENEAKRDRMKLVNKLYKKGDAEGLAALGIDHEKLKAKLEAAGAYWGSKPHLPYEITNLGARIRSDKERIETIKRRNATTEKAEAAGGLVIETAHGYAVVTFAEKPERDVLTALREAGFHWSAPSWYGSPDKVPAIVQNMASVQ